MYPHKSGCQKWQERIKREIRQKKGQQTLFQVGLLAPSTLPKEDFPGPSVLKKLEKTVVSPVCNPLKEEGADVIEEEIHSYCSDRKNVKSSIGLDIGCITNEFPSQVEIEKYIMSGHIPLPKQFPKDLNNQTSPESNLKFWGTKGELHKTDWLVWSQKKEGLYCFPCQHFWHTTSASSSRSALYFTYFAGKEVFKIFGSYCGCNSRLLPHWADNISIEVC